MTADQGRDAIVAYVASRRGWVPIGELGPWMARELKVTYAVGANDLRNLVAAGRLERRANPPPGSKRSWLKHYDYRVPA